MEIIYLLVPLSLVLIGHALYSIVRQPNFGPIPHRVTISGDRP